MHYVHQSLGCHLGMLFMVTHVYLLGFNRCSLVFDEANQEAMKNKYCSEFGDCPPGTHVMCMYGDQHIMGPRCGGGRPLPLTEDETIHILKVFNEYRSKMVEGFKELPKAYSMPKLSWDDTLADFAQIWANQCDGSRRDICRATEKFPGPGQSLATKLFLYPNWGTANKPTIGVSNDDPEPSTRMIAIEAYLEAVYRESNGLEREHIHRHPYKNRNSFLIAIFGRTTHVGCGMSTYPDYYKSADDKPVIYHAVEVVCNFSSEPMPGEKIYQTIPTSCPEGYSQENGLCIEPNQGSDPEKDNTQNEKGDNSNENKQNNDEKGEKSKENGNKSKEKGNNSQENGENSKEKGNNSKENGNNSKEKGNDSKENGNKNKEKGNSSKEKGNNSKENRNNDKEKGNHSKENGNNSKEKGNNSKENGNNNKEKGNNSKENGNNSKENKEKHNNSKEKGDTSTEKGGNSKENGNNSKGKGDNSKEKGGNSKENGNNSKGKGDNSKENTKGACVMDDPKCSPHVVILPIITIEDGDPNKLRLHGLQGSPQTPALTKQMELSKQLLRQKIKARVQNVRDQYFTEYVLLNPGTRMSNGRPIDEDTFVLSKHVPKQIADKNLEKPELNLSANKRRLNIEIKSRRDFSDIDDVVSEYLLNLSNNKSLGSQSNVLASSVNGMRNDRPVKIPNYQNPNSQPLLNRKQDRTYKEYNNLDNERERLLSDLNTSGQNFEDFAVNRYINNIATNKVIEDNSYKYINLGAINKEILHDDLLRNREITDFTDYEPQDYEEQQDHWSKRNQKLLHTHDQISNYDYSQLENYQGYRENDPQAMVIIDEYNGIQNGEKIYENSGIQNGPYVYDADEITHYYLDRLAPKVTRVTDTKEDLSREIMDFESKLSDNSVMDHERFARHVEATVTESIMNHLMKELSHRYPQAKKRPKSVQIMMKNLKRRLNNYIPKKKPRLTRLPKIISKKKGKIMKVRNERPNKQAKKVYSRKPQRVNNKTF